MKPRISLMSVGPGVIHAMLGLEKQVSKTGLDSTLLDLVRMRASQINGCAYCLPSNGRKRSRSSDREDVHALRRRAVWPPVVRADATRT